MTGKNTGRSKIPKKTQEEDLKSLKNTGIRSKITKKTSE